MAGKDLESTAVNAQSSAASYLWIIPTQLCTCLACRPLRPWNMDFFSIKTQIAYPQWSSFVLSYRTAKNKQQPCFQKMCCSAKSAPQKKTHSNKKKPTPPKKKGKPQHKTKQKNPHKNKTHTQKKKKTQPQQENPNKSSSQQFYSVRSKVIWNKSLADFFIILLNPIKSWLNFSCLIYPKVESCMNSSLLHRFNPVL